MKYRIKTIKNEIRTEYVAEKKLWFGWTRVHGNYGYLNTKDTFFHQSNCETREDVIKRIKDEIKNKKWSEMIADTEIYFEYLKEIK